MERQRLDKAGDGRIGAKSDQIITGSDGNLAPFPLSHPFLAKAQQPSVGNPRNEGATSMAGNSFTWAIYWSLLLLPVYLPPLHQLVLFLIILFVSVVFFVCLHSDRCCLHLQIINNVTTRLILRLLRSVIGPGYESCNALFNLVICSLFDWDRAVTFILELFVSRNPLSERIHLSWFELEEIQVQFVLTAHWNFSL